MSAPAAPPPTTIADLSDDADVCSLACFLLCFRSRGRRLTTDCLCWQAWIEFERRRRALIAAGNDIFRDAAASAGPQTYRYRMTRVVLLCVQNRLVFAADRIAPTQAMATLTKLTRQEVSSFRAVFAPVFGKIDMSASDDDDDECRRDEVGAVACTDR